MGELNVDLLETFKVEGLPDLADTSKSTVVAKLRCFLREAFRRGWITEPLVERVRAHRAVYDQKEPYSDEEVEKVLSEALKLNGGTHGYAKYPKTFRLLLELMLETGMRVPAGASQCPRVLIDRSRYFLARAFSGSTRSAARNSAIASMLPASPSVAPSARWAATK